MVESQFASSTLRLVDNIREHEILEDILEASKPPIPDEAKGLHYLLFSPFRYAHTAMFGTRFRAKGDPGVFYGAETPRTAACEVGYWRWMFVQDSEGLKRLSPSSFTAFSVPLDDLSVDLREKPFNRDAVRWQHPSDYSATQAFAKITRQTKVGVIFYKSVRSQVDSFCVAVLDPKAFAQKSPDANTQAWVLTIADEVIWSRNQGEESFSLTF